MTPSAGNVVAERYRLERPLRQGGMGTVWLAHHVALKIPCAVKFIHSQAASEPEIRARFEREAVAAAQLRSPNVVQILDHGIWQGVPYIAMEYLEGEDLRTHLSRTGPMPPADVQAIVAQVARALAKAHALGLVHRDLKPANIFLVRDDDREIAKVLDFGVAKQTAGDASMSIDSETKTGAILGTPFYMSPEQARGNRGVDHRADLWALAVVVFQCLTGKLPFRGDTFGDLLVRIMMEAPPVPSQVAPVPPGFDAWWARAVDHDITRRFQTARELSEALAVALDLSHPQTVAMGPARESMPEVVVPAPKSVPRAPSAEVPLLDSGLLKTAIETVATPQPRVSEASNGPARPSEHGMAGTLNPATAAAEAPRPRGKLVALAGAGVAVVVALAAFVTLHGSTGAAPAGTAAAAAPGADAPVTMGETPKPPARPDATVVATATSHAAAPETAPAPSPATANVPAAAPTTAPSASAAAKATEAPAKTSHSHAPVTTAAPAPHAAAPAPTTAPAAHTPRNLGF